jgi:hypothetical protein
MTGKKIKTAKKIYKSLIRMMDANEWKYQKYDETLSVSHALKLNNNCYKFVIGVWPREQLVHILVAMPFELPNEMPEERKRELAYALCKINSILDYGFFTYRIEENDISFRTTTCYCKSDIAAKIYGFMLGLSIKTADQFANKLAMLANGEITSDQIWDDNAPQAK